MNDADAYTAHFRQHIVPLLREEARRVALLLALDVYDWDEAEDEVAQVATRYGAARLRGGPPAH